MKSTFYLLVAIFCLGWIKLAPPLESKDQRQQLNLCQLQENKTGSVKGIITTVNKNESFTIVDPKTSCSSLVLTDTRNEVLPELKLQTGLSFKATVQAGLLKNPRSFVYQNNLGEVQQYREVIGYCYNKPRFKRESSTGIIEIYDTFGNKIKLYINKNLAANLSLSSPIKQKYYYDRNNILIHVE